MSISLALSIYTGPSLLGYPTSLRPPQHVKSVPSDPAGVVNQTALYFNIKRIQDLISVLF